MKHIKGLDTLRAFAVLIVIIEHWGPHKFRSAMLTFIFSRIIPEGTFGVDLFFVLSGYLITQILLTARDKAKPNERLNVIKNFYIRRILRIFPIYFLLVFIVAYILNNEFTKDNIIYFLTYTSNFLVFKTMSWQGIAHTWSLAVEEQFYIIWPWVIIYSPKRYLFGIILLTIAIGILSSLILQFLYGTFFYVLPLPCITAFSIGALYAYVQTYQRFKKLITLLFLSLLPICLILLFLHNMGTQLTLIRAINSIIAINVIIYVSKENYNIITRFIFNNKPLANLGKISYGIYLYHYIFPSYYYIFINYLLIKISLGKNLIKIITMPPPAYLIHLVIVFLISFISYKYIELPFLKLKKHFSYLPDKETIVHNIEVQ